MTDIRKCAQTVVDDYCIYKYVTPKSMKKLEQALAEPVEPVCNPHPDAPHGFNRNASHTEDRYVCDCESWEPPSVDALIGEIDLILENAESFGDEIDLQDIKAILDKYRGQK